MGFKTFLIVYLFGGLTFIPLLVVLAIYLTTQPVLSVDPALAPAADAAAASEKHSDDANPSKDDNGYDGLVLPGDDVKTLESMRRDHAAGKTHDKPTKSSKTGKDGRKHRAEDRNNDFATAGYFSVHRKYVTIGNSKPVEPGAVGPTPVAPPSPSVYQTFFRNMLKKNGADSAEGSNAASPRPKNARNMFYVVLRHGHLILFDDDQQVDVRHVIKLADHDIKISSGGGPTPEGELFIKRNAIHLSPRNLQRAKAHNAPTPQPWFFFCENCSEKEDFYFSLIRSQENAPRPHDIDVRHLTSLMERLHASEEAAEMRWLNALIGRLFLGVYKTTDVLNFVQSKIVTKLSRMPRPNFVASLQVQRVDIGETTPQITSPRLKSLTAEGECIVEADVRYTGRFEVDVAAVLRVSTPIGQQEVKTSLAIVLTHLEGHILFKIKAPPSNRIWFSFRHMPKIEMEVRPIIMARQLTWPVFIQMIEGKIKEAIAESIVLPFWDDTPFFSTESKECRGGLWEDETDKAHDGTAIRTDFANGVDENASPAVQRLRRLSKANSSQATPTLSSTSVNSLPDSSNTNSGGRSSSFKKMSKKNRSTSDVNKPNISLSPNGDESPPKLPARPSTLSNASDPNGDAEVPLPSPLRNGQNSSNAMSWLSSGTLRSRASSLTASDVGTPTGLGLGTTPRQQGRPQSSKSNASEANPFFPHVGSESTDGVGKENEPVSPASLAARAATFANAAATPPLHSKKSMERAATVAATPDREINAKTGTVIAAAMTGAAQSAKRWGINALQRRATNVAERKAKAELEHRKGSAELDLSKPMGGGLPLPPLGEPLPLPSQLAPKPESVAAAASPTPTKKIKRKQIQSHAQPASSNQNLTGGSTARASVPHLAPDLRPQQDLLVVAAPVESEPEDDDVELGASSSANGSDSAHPSTSSQSLGSAASGHEHGDDDHASHADGDDEHWGNVAESVMNAFFEEENGQNKDHDHSQLQEESLISFDVGDESIADAKHQS